MEVSGAMFTVLNRQLNETRENNLKINSNQLKESVSGCDWLKRMNELLEPNASLIRMWANTREF